MIVWGGLVYRFPSEVRNTGGRYDPVTDSWSATSAGANVPSARTNHTAVWTGSTMIVWGGGSSVAGTTPVNTGGRYDPGTDSWTPTGTGANVPGVRAGHAAVWTGSEMIVWGGGNPETLTTGGRYDPVSDSWVPTGQSQTNSPPPQQRILTWTGSEMVVHGAASRIGYRYDPALNAWTNTSVGAVLPRAIGGIYPLDPVWTGLEVIMPNSTVNQFETIRFQRYDPVSDSWKEAVQSGSATSSGGLRLVWTGTRMLAYQPGIVSGRRYDPKTDTWSPMSVANAPVARFNATMVWTGTEMIVWGGSVQGCYPGDSGGRYDPATDTWTPTGLSGTPPGRRTRHVAEWTGTRMIVWGGQDTDPSCNVTRLGDGSQYDPLTETWTPISSGGAPSARVGAQSVWTGTELIVWGGGGSSNTDLEGPLNTGGRYDPSTNAWTPTSLIGVPFGRGRTSTIRTEHAMMVWGGIDPVTATGALYCASPCTPRTWYRDQDGDRYGVATDTQSACVAPTGYVNVKADCDDTNAAVHLGATEACNFIDDDCDFAIDEGFNTDGDAYTTCAGDCNDTNGTIYPGAPQLCDGKNNDCSDPSWPAVPANEANADSDGFRICAGDCNDASASTYPGAPQLCNGVNDNCSDPSWPAVPANEADADADGYRICQNDCNDANALVNPGRAETCNGIDDNCAGGIDEDASGEDSDADGVHNRRERV